MHFLVKEMRPSVKYIFRVWAYSIIGMFLVNIFEIISHFLLHSPIGMGKASEQIEYRIQSKCDSLKHYFSGGILACKIYSK